MPAPRPKSDFNQIFQFLINSMKLKVYIIGRSQFDNRAFHTFLRTERTSWKQTASATEAEEIVEAAGRICYMSFGKNQSPRSNEMYIQHLVRMGHESVLEHASWTFLLTGVSRAFTHQLVRHRVGFAFSQLSQQYHDEMDAQFVEPSVLNLSPKAKAAWLKAVKASKQAYREILGALEKVRNPTVLGSPEKEIRRSFRSTARSVLPNATETKIVVTGNARALRYFIKTRGAIVGDEEMRRVSAALLKRLQQEAPAMFSDFRIEKLPDGSPIVRWPLLPIKKK